MPVTLDQAKEIIQAVTIDVWNTSSKTERIALMEKYCSPQMKSYPPDGSVTTGVEECDGAYDKLHADGRHDWKFRLSGELWMLGNMVMAYWFFGKGDEGWEGWDVVVLDEEGKVASLYGLVKGLHSHLN